MVASEVIDTRPGPSRIRRRRLCQSCGERFTTSEVIVPPRIKITRRQIMLMRSRGLTYEDIAGRLQVSPTTVWLRVNG